MEQKDQTILEAFAKSVINDPAFSTVPKKHAREAAAAEALGLPALESQELAAFNTFRKIAEGGLSQTGIEQDARVTSQDMKTVIAYGNSDEAPAAVKMLVKNKTRLLENLVKELGQSEKGAWVNRVQETSAPEKKRGLG